MLETIKNAYAIYEQLNISVTGLIVAALILALAFLFAVREAATWFFKVDDLKRDIHRLGEITVQLEGEIRALQNLLSQAKNQAQLNLVAVGSEKIESTSREPMTSSSGSHLGASSAVHFPLHH